MGISSDGHKEFLGLALGGRESTNGWEGFLLHLIRRGLGPKRLKLVVVDGNPGLLLAIDKLLPEISIQKDLDSVLTVHKFPYRHWEKIGTPDIIDKTFREFRRRTMAMDSFPTEKSCMRITFALANLLNDD